MVAVIIASVITAELPIDSRVSLFGCHGRFSGDPAFGYLRHG